MPASGIVKDKGDAKFDKPAPGMVKSKPADVELKKGGNVKDHHYGKNVRKYAAGGSVVGFGKMPKMNSNMCKVDSERDE